MTASADHEAHLLDIAAEVFAEDRSSLSLDTSVDDLATWDSWGHVALIEAVEQAFGLALPVAETVAVKSLKDLLAILHRSGR